MSTRTQLVEAILLALVDGPLTAADIHARTRGTSHQFSGALIEVEDSGKAVYIKGKWVLTCVKNLPASVCEKCRW